MSEATKRPKDQNDNKKQTNKQNNNNKTGGGAGVEKQITKRMV